MEHAVFNFTVTGVTNPDSLNDLMLKFIAQVENAGGSVDEAEFHVEEDDEQLEEETTAE